ncbi:hypothetical protein LIA77_10265 [Sarocladium implicatum]|nr:hypothetical protein LIA77_10265 [Sarocladium implicatum]
MSLNVLECPPIANRRIIEAILASVLTWPPAAKSCGRVKGAVLWWHNKGDIERSVKRGVTSGTSCGLYIQVTDAIGQGLCHNSHYKSFTPHRSTLRSRAWQPRGRSPMTLQ